MPLTAASTLLSWPETENPWLLVRPFARQPATFLGEERLANHGEPFKAKSAQMEIRDRSNALGGPANVSVELTILVDNAGCYGSVIRACRQFVSSSTPS